MRPFSDFASKKWGTFPAGTAQRNQQPVNTELISANSFFLTAMRNCDLGALRLRHYDVWIFCCPAT